MYQVGDLVVYGVHGVCRISAFQERMVDHVKRQYMVLEPTNREGSQYLIPTHNPVAMNKISCLLNKQELETLVTSRKIRTENWIADENKRKQFYRDMSGSGSRESMLQTLYTLYCHRERQHAMGKKLHICDENFLHDAEKVLSGEIEAVLGVSAPEALNYLRKMLVAQVEA